MSKIFCHFRSLELVRHTDETVEKTNWRVPQAEATLEFIVV